MFTETHPNTTNKQNKKNYPLHSHQIKFKLAIQEGCHTCTLSTHCAVNNGSGRPPELNMLTYPFYLKAQMIFTFCVVLAWRVCDKEREDDERQGTK